MAQRNCCSSEPLSHMVADTWWQRLSFWRLRHFCLWHLGWDGWKSSGQLSFSLHVASWLAALPHSMVISAWSSFLHDGWLLPSWGFHETKAETASFPGTLLESHCIPFMSFNEWQRTVQILGERGLTLGMSNRITYGSLWASLLYLPLLTWIQKSQAQVLIFDSLNHYVILKKVICLLKACFPNFNVEIILPHTQVDGEECLTWHESTLKT